MYCPRCATTIPYKEKSCSSCELSVVEIKQTYNRVIRGLQSTKIKSIFDYKNRIPSQCALCGLQNGRHSVYCGNNMENKH